MQVGDMVLVTFGLHEESVVGVFISDDTEAVARDSNGDKVITRAHVLWDGEVYSTPLDQLEVIDGCR